MKRWPAATAKPGELAESDCRVEARTWSIAPSPRSLAPRCLVPEPESAQPLSPPAKSPFGTMLVELASSANVTS